MLLQACYSPSLVIKKCVKRVYFLCSRLAKLETSAGGRSSGGTPRQVDNSTPNYNLYSGRNRLWWLKRLKNDHKSGEVIVNPGGNQERATKNKSLLQKTGYLATADGDTHNLTQTCILYIWVGQKHLCCFRVDKTWPNHQNKYWRSASLQNVKMLHSCDV